MITIMHSLLRYKNERLNKISKGLSSFFSEYKINKIEIQNAYHYGNDELISHQKNVRGPIVFKNLKGYKSWKRKT